MSHTEASGKNEVTLLAGAATAPGEGDRKTMLKAALDGIIELSGAARGMVLVVGDDGRILYGEARTASRRDLDLPRLPVSRTVLEKVRERGLPFWEERPLARRESELLRHLLVASLGERSRVCGLVYLDHEGAVIPRETLPFAQGLSQLAVLAVERAADAWRWQCLDARRYLRRRRGPLMGGSVAPASAGPVIIRRDRSFRNVGRWSTRRWFTSFKEVGRWAGFRQALAIH